MDHLRSWSTETGTEELLLDTLQTMRRTVSRQVRNSLRAFHQRDAGLANAVIIKDGYVDNLNSQAQSLAHRLDTAGATQVARCGWTIAANLEHIGDYAVNIAKQHAYRIQDGFPIGTNPLKIYRRLIINGLRLAMNAFERRRMREAFAVCRLEEEIDQLYAADLACLLEHMGEGGEKARDALTWAFAAKNMERMGDMLLNMGEAILSMIFGDKLKLAHLRTLEDLLPTSRISTTTVHGGISGALVALVEEDDKRYIFKGGGGAKLAREYENLIRWSREVPGVTPRVIRAPASDPSAGMLLEFIPGPTLEDVVLRHNEPLDRPLALLMALVERVWKSTLFLEPSPSSFVRQIDDRLGALFDLHPEFKKVRARELRLGSQAFPSLKAMLAEAAEREATLTCPFSVLLHGDFNLNNLLVTTAPKCDPPTSGGENEGRCVRAVDVGRTGYGDPAQDLSVLMVSCVRHPLAMQNVPGRARYFYSAIEKRGSELAMSLGDPNFKPRLKLGLARSYITSGRVVRDSEQARLLFLRGIRLLEEFLGVRHLNEEQS